MEESLKIAAVQKAEKRLCEEPFDRLRINSATKQSPTSKHGIMRLVRFTRKDGVPFWTPRTFKKWKKPYNLYS